MNVGIDTGVELPTRLTGTAFAVRTESLTKQFGARTAVSDVTLTVPEGSVYVLVGPNGAGKTTTFRMILGMLRPTEGHVDVMGVRAGPGGECRAHVGYVPEGRSVPYPWIRVNDLLAHHARYYPTWDAQYAAHLVDALDLRLKDKYGRLSKGEARRVELVMALAHRPPLLLLDEPTDGLDPVIRATVLSLLAEHMTESPTTMLIATHLIYEMERFADHIGVMRSGRLMAQMHRDDIQVRLRRYLLDVPDAWSAPVLPIALVKENGTPRERQWTIWGDEAHVRGQLTAAGAHVRSVSALTLDEAALALLSTKERV
ncbi:MAG: ABC transporter ATP-binding protein [Longimicrobiales bacterium]